MGELQECRYCGTDQQSEDEGHNYPPYTYDEWVCDECWDNCPECGECDEWTHNTYSSTRRSNKKQCPECGFEFITKPATG